jgi:hypothetical protein
MLAPKASVTGPDIVDLLLAVRDCHCADPRDKIFGTLSLVQNWDDIKPIRADYCKHTRQVFTDIALKCYRARSMVSKFSCSPKD